MSDYNYGLLESEHRRGVPWNEAPRPRRLHRCRPWTVEVYDDGGRREHCACGAVRLDGGAWEGRNTR